jgi:hypothetical protein
VKGENEESGPIAGLIPRPPGPTDVTLPLLLLLVATMGVVAWRLSRRHGPTA